MKLLSRVEKLSGFHQKNLKRASSHERTCTKEKARSFSSLLLSQNFKSSNTVSLCNHSSNCCSDLNFFMQSFHSTSVTNLKLSSRGRITKIETTIDLSIHFYSFSLARRKNYSEIQGSVLRIIATAIE